VYINSVAIEFDPAKSDKNKEERGLPFEMAEDFDLETAIIRRDDRFDYPELRFQAIGPIHGIVHLLVFTPLESGAIRVISLRRANRKERREWLASRTPT